MSKSRLWRAVELVVELESCNPSEDEEDIEDFWGQLWFILKSKPSLPRSRVRAKSGESLVWIRQDLWRAKAFSPADCYLVGESDTWVQSPQQLKFAELFWGEEKKRSLAQVIKEAMAGHGRGRGPRPRSPEDDWERWGGGGWNQYQFSPLPPLP